MDLYFVRKRVDFPRFNESKIKQKEKKSHSVDNTSYSRFKWSILISTFYFCNVYIIRSNSNHMFYIIEKALLNWLGAPQSSGILLSREVWECFFSPLTVREGELVLPSFWHTIYVCLSTKQASSWHLLTGGKGLNATKTWAVLRIAIQIHLNLRQILVLFENTSGFLVFAGFLMKNWNDLPG